MVEAEEVETTIGKITTACQEMVDIKETAVLDNGIKEGHSKGIITTVEVVITAQTETTTGPM